MTLVRIVADDLTGALDAAAPLVGPAGPLPVLWDVSAAAAAHGSFALDSELRDRAAPAEGWLAALRGADLAFKKIDSLLRGRTVDEIAACLTSGAFASAVIAPAFPAQQRIMRGGRQYWRPTATTAWQAVEVDLLAEVRRRGLPVRPAPSADQIAGRGFFLCDAVVEDDLREIVRAGQALAGPLLWIGTAGLARALAGPVPPADATPLPAPLLVVIGSHHPVTLAQAAQLAARAPADAIVTVGLDGPDPTATAEGVAAALAVASTRRPDLRTGRRHRRGCRGAAVRSRDGAGDRAGDAAALIGGDRRRDLVPPGARARGRRPARRGRADAGHCGLAPSGRPLAGCDRAVQIRRFRRARSARTLVAGCAEL